jgi:heptosyltransferase I
MKILVVRLSSLGDILHLFPAISDLRRCFPSAEIHWLVEPAFAEMTGWHSAVNKVIAAPLRRHKKTWWKIPGLLKGLKEQLKAEKYDLVIDAQGLLKSAMLSSLSGIDVYGFSADSARESLAAKFYKKTASVPKGLHVVEKNRQLIEQLFGADISYPADFGLEAFRQKQMADGLPEHLKVFVEQPAIVLLHGTTWNSKYWPEASWQELVQRLGQQGFRCLLPWGNEEEHQRALRLAGGAATQVLPKLSLGELAGLLLHARGFVSVETGIGHLAAILVVPGIMLHGPTDPEYSGIMGRSCVHITSGLDCSPCFKRDCPILDPASGIPPCQQKISAQMVFRQCMEQFSGSGN